ncbi:thioredoxin-like protein 5 [Rhodotorula toruloides]|uniref:Thioredoxin-like protein 5 n=1 Tax=Rhodotorula toruloides TaxID=5286 RepID=A0A511K8T3_RHOTO|nr:thioredoxin-like protein 5 [Rhodotorula toruloides]
MPLLFPDAQITPQTVLEQANKASSSSPHFLIFFASIDPNTGKPWCPDCSEVQSEVDRLVPENRSTLVFVGDRTEWKKPNNPWRSAPFNISRIPTIIRVEQGGDQVASSLDNAPRLIESELRDPTKFQQFVA